MTNPTENSSENQKTKSGGQFHGCRMWSATNSASITTPCSLRIQCHSPHVSTSPSSNAAWPPVRSYCYYRNGEPAPRSLINCRAQDLHGKLIARAAALEETTISHSQDLQAMRIVRTFSQAHP